MSKKMVIKGVGEMFANKFVNGVPTARLMSVGKLQDIKFDYIVNIDDIFGGDGYFPFDTLVRDKAIEISATDAQFDLSFFELMMGSVVQHGITDDAFEVYERHGVGGSGIATEKTVITITQGATTAEDLVVTLNSTPVTIALSGAESESEVATAIASAVNMQSTHSAVAVGPTVIITAAIAGVQVDTTVNVGTTGVTALVDVATQGANASGTVGFILDYSPSASDPQVVVTLTDSNTILTTITSGSPTATQAKYDAGTHSISLHTSHAGKNAIVSYKRSYLSDKVDLLADDVPYPLYIVHKGVFVQADGSKAGIITELFKVRAQGTFSINFARASAATSQMSLKLIDPERADKKVASIRKIVL
jgi:hypothetical protein